MLEVRGQQPGGARHRDLCAALARWAVLVGWVVLAWCAPAAAAGAKADFAADAKRLDAALAKPAPVPPRVVARGLVVRQARALAADARFRAAVRKEADRRGAKLADAMLAQPKLFTATALQFTALMAMQRSAVADQLAARSEREAKRLTGQEAKDAQLAEARNKLDAAKKRAASAPPLPTTLDATALLAAFLVLGTDDPATLGEKTAEVAGKVEEAVDAAGDAYLTCCEAAQADYEACVEGDPLNTAYCGILLSAAMLECLTP